jgi:glycosyltransferase involved in cell wall biosynthesis
MTSTRDRGRQLRIAHVHWAFPPTTGGVESHLADLARLQAAAGHSVTVVTGEPRPLDGPNYAVVSCALLELDHARAHTGDRAYEETLRATLGRLFSQLKVDVIHGHNLHHFAPEPALVLDALRHELHFALHHTFHETWPDLLHETPIYRSWDANYTVSRFVQSECVTRLGFRPILLSPGVDAARFRTTRATFSRAGEAPLIVHPARLLPWKGVHVTVRALAALRAEGLTARLLLTDTQRIADWDRELAGYRGDVLGLVESLGLRDVELRPVPYAEMPALYEEADIVVYPTVGKEPFGLVPLEAMSCERAVVASISGGIAETVVDGQTGYVVEPGDADALAARLAALLRDPDLARRLGRAGRARVLAAFDLRRHVSTLEGLYRRSLRARDALL